MKKELNKVEQQLYDAALKECRYYKGEEECPYSSMSENGMLWIWEQGYCHLSYDADSGELFARYVAELNRAGLGSYKDEDGVPLRLKALVFSKWNDKQHDSIADFKAMYEKYYK